MRKMALLLWLSLLLLVAGCATPTDAPEPTPPPEEPVQEAPPASTNPLPRTTGSSPLTQTLPTTPTPEPERNPESLALLANAPAQPHEPFSDPAQTFGAGTATEVVLHIFFYKNEFDFTSYSISAVWDIPTGIVYEGWTMLPLEQYFYSIGYEVQQQGEEITICRDGQEWLLAVGQDTAQHEGQTYWLSAALLELDGIVYLPVADLPELFGKYLSVAASSNHERLVIYINDFAFLNLNETVNERNFDIDEEQEGTTYVLKPQVQTARGIQVGDTLAEVLAAYGPPHRMSWQAGEISSLLYIAPATPQACLDYHLLFSFEDDLVLSVTCTLL